MVKITIKDVTAAFFAVYFTAVVMTLPPPEENPEFWQAMGLARAALSYLALGV